MLECIHRPLGNIIGVDLPLQTMGLVQLLHPFEELQIPLDSLAVIPYIGRKSDIAVVADEVNPGIGLKVLGQVLHGDESAIRVDGKIPGRSDNLLEEPCVADVGGMGSFEEECVPHISCGTGFLGIIAMGKIAAISFLRVAAVEFADQRENLRIVQHTLAGTVFCVVHERTHAQRHSLVQLHDSFFDFRVFGEIFFDECSFSFLQGEYPFATASASGTAPIRGSVTTVTGEGECAIGISEVEQFLTLLGGEFSRIHWNPPFLMGCF